MISPDPLQPPTAPEDRIYVAYHDVRPILRGRHFFPLQAGRAVTCLRLDGVPGDDTGDNNSALNTEYFELTAHYSAWRNGPAQGAVGLMHYQRVLDLSGRISPRGYADRYAAYFDPLAYASDVAAHFATGAARPPLVVPRPILRRVVAERRQDFLADLDRALSGQRLLLGNIFVMDRPIFQDYSQLLFDILPEARARILAGDPGAAKGYQGRYPGFLAERVLTAYALEDRLREQSSGLCPVHRRIVNTDAAGLSRLWSRGGAALGPALALWAGLGRRGCAGDRR